jgi:hypothetical protein
MLRAAHHELALLDPQVARATGPGGCLNAVTSGGTQCDIIMRGRRVVRLWDRGAGRKGRSKRRPLSAYVPEGRSVLKGPRAPSLRRAVWVKASGSPAKERRAARDAIRGCQLVGPTSLRILGRGRHPAQPSNTRHRLRSNGLVCRRGAPGIHAASGEAKDSAVDGLARRCWGLAATSPDIRRPTW